MTSRLAILGVAAALAGCDSARPENVGASVPGNEPSRPAATPDRVAAEEQVASALLITLEDEGVRLVDPATGSARPLPFGTPAATAIGALGAAAGAPPVEQSVNSECGAGPILHARWANGLVALFQEDRFLGWDSREPGLATATSDSAVLPPIPRA